MDTLSGMQKDSLQRGPPPDEASARHYCLHRGRDAPDLVTVKDFLRFYIATSRGKIVEKPTADSVNTRNGRSTEDMRFQRVDDKSDCSASGSPKRVHSQCISVSGVARSK